MTIDKVSNKSKVLHGISSQTLVVLIIGIVEIVFFSIMTRILSKEDFGFFAAVSAITIIFSTFADSGIGSAVVQKKKLDDEFKNNAFSLSLIIGFVVSSILIILSGPIANLIIDKTLKIPLMIMSITLICNSLVSVNYSLLQRKLQFFRIGMINLFSLLISIIISVFLAIKGFGFYAIIIKSVLYSILTLILSFCFVKEKFKWNINQKTIKSIWGFSGWLLFSVILRNIGLQIDRLVMGRLLSVTSLGAYNRPKEFIDQISNKLNGIFDTVLFPVLSGIQNDVKSLSTAYKTSLYYMNIFSMLLALTFIFNSQLIIRIFLGEEWISVKFIFIILSINLIFNIDGRLSDCYFRSLGLTKQQFYFRFIQMVLTTSLVISGIFMNKMLGAAIGFTCANFLMVFLKLHYLTSRLLVPFTQVFEILLSSWRFILYIIPIMIFSHYLLPTTLLGDFLNLLIFLLLLFVQFIIFPRVVGEKYYKGAYHMILTFLKK